MEENTTNTQIKADILGIATIMPIKCEENDEKKFDNDFVKKEISVDGNAKGFPVGIKFAEECQFCDKTFDSKRRFNRHQKTVHRGEKELKDFTCNFCEKTFKYSQRHI